MDFMEKVMTAEQARQILAAHASNGLLLGEGKLGGSRHEARFTLATSDGESTPWQAAETYIINSPADVFVFNVTKQGTRGRAKTPVKDRLYIAFYTKAAVLEGVRRRAKAFTIHTNNVTLHRVGVLEMTQSFGLPICAIECSFSLKDIPADPDPKRARTPYAKYWENYISQTIHCHNVANLRNSRYDFRIICN